MNNAFKHESYLVRKKILTLAGAKFHIYDPQGELVFFSKLKAFKLKENIRLFTDETMQNELLNIQARNIIDIAATYDVIDPESGDKVGALRRKGLKSILKDEWVILDVNDNEIGLIKEDNVFLALLRRFLTNLIPQTYLGEISGRQICKFKQNFNPFVTKITLDFSEDKQHQLDRRLGIAAAVLLCAIEGKQS
ncbi:MAG: hypothetical protein PF904_09075 [Kiritimatiellae bacterium]|jgi:uncharacterized protein YxjI|nr:hypothetical protein [Kiritimatiellia bacterium]